MNPCIVIPTYWCGPDYQPSNDLFGTYDHMTPVSEDGELPRCLKSLTQVKGVCRIIIPVVSEGCSPKMATDKVKDIAAMYPALDIVVVGTEELQMIHAMADALGHPEYKEAITNVGYGSIRNLGLLVAAVLGHTEVVFIDDDEIIQDQDFLITALYGLGKYTKRGIPILAKTGYFLDRKGSYLSGSKEPWYNMALKQGAAFDEWMTQAMSGSRLKRSNTCYGGCMSVHIEAFRRVAFDPWIARGEDLDYLLNLRMYGHDVWFDTKFSLRHLPPATLSEAARFKADTYRWIYEQRKLEYLKSQIDLLQIRPRDLDPYPGPFIEPSINRKLRATGLLRSIARKDTSGYFKAATTDRKDANRYAEEHCSQYFRFQMVWPKLIEVFENNEELASRLTEGRERRHSGYTESFSAISDEAVWEQETADTAEAIMRRWTKASDKARRGEGRKRPQNRRR